MKELLDSLFTQLTPLKPISTGESYRVGAWKGNSTSQKTTQKIRSVVFDVYGTLLISDSGDIGNTQHRSQYVVEAFRQFQPPESDTSWITNQIGEQAIPLFKQTIDRSHRSSKEQGIEYPEVRIEDIWGEVIQEVSKGKGSTEQEVLKNISMAFEFKNNPTYPMPGMQDILETLHSENIVLGIVSNAQFFTPMLLQHFLQGEVDKNKELPFFEKDLCVYSYKERMAKPGIGLYQILKRKLEAYGLAPEETLYIGNDMLNDIYPAHQLGFQTGLFAGDKRSLRKREEDLRVQGIEPDWVFTELSDIQKVIHQ